MIKWACMYSYGQSWASPRQSWMESGTKTVELYGWKQQEAADHGYKPDGAGPEVTSIWRDPWTCSQHYLVHSVWQHCSNFTAEQTLFSHVKVEKYLKWWVNGAGTLGQQNSHVWICHNCAAGEPLGQPSNMWAAFTGRGTVTETSGSKCTVV